MTKHFCVSPPPIPQTRGVGLRDKLWQPGETINIYFLEGTPEQHAFVIEQASKWLQYANLHFNFDSSLADSDIRISFNPDIGSWSYVGTDCRLIPTENATMNFSYFELGGPDNAHGRVAIHEFGHALGMIHGQYHPNANIPWNEETRQDWTRHNPYVNEDLVYNGYDMASTMAYFITNDQTIGDFEIPVNYPISRLDGEWASERYPFGDGGSTTIPPVPGDGDGNTVFMPVGVMR